MPAESPEHVSWKLCLRYVRLPFLFPLPNTNIHRHMHIRLSPADYPTGSLTYLKSILKAVASGRDIS